MTDGSEWRVVGLVGARCGDMGCLSMRLSQRIVQRRVRSSLKQPPNALLGPNTFPALPALPTHPLTPTGST
eukprot:361330-Chlamydomonas_euryale.AAC.1